jgi:hypothetical protein
LIAVPLSNHPKVAEFSPKIFRQANIIKLLKLEKNSILVSKVNVTKMTLIAEK